jgi:cytidine deaminase
MEEKIIRQLIKKAKEAKEFSYSPYSEFRVGSALLCEKGIYCGCNIENSAYSPTVCAERTAFFKAVSEGARDFEAIAICGGDNGKKGSYCPPCGVCRQVMTEFCKGDFMIILANDENDYMICALNDLMPLRFDSGSIKK